MEKKENDLGMTFQDAHVTGVAAGKWAARNGVQVGDEIFLVNEARFAGMNGLQRYRALTQRRPFVISFRGRQTETERRGSAVLADALFGAVNSVWMRRWENGMQLGRKTGAKTGGFVTNPSGIETRHGASSEASEGHAGAFPFPQPAD